ncbi:peptide deformylase [Patescibacteria group bacterium]|nr:peptide deformylase [Patescibacteria group bacterium]
MTLKIETGKENEILRTMSVPVKTIDKKILKLLKEMGKSMKEEKGVGLAAPQVGHNIRMILVLLDNKILVPMINPQITAHSDATDMGEEGCLSLPGIWGNVGRYHEITIEYQDEKGAKRILKLECFNARVVQHEIDHLNGVLFTDYLDAEDSLLNVMSQKETERL